MKRIAALAVALIAVGSLVAADYADARRLGGGRTLGAQRSMPSSPAPTSPSVTPTPATPPGAATNPVMPAQPGAPNYARPAAPATGAAAAAATTPARAGMSRWLAPVAGIAAGLGLAALLSHFGLSETFAAFALIALAVLAIGLLLRFALARRKDVPSPLRYAGASPAAAKGYATDVRPSSGGARVEPVVGGAAGRYPPGFDPGPFLAQARAQFTRLQSAYDSGDRRALADVMTPDLFAEISRELDTRGTQVPTEVVSLNAEIQQVVTEGDRHWASVRFYGLTREDGASSPAPFDEVWNLVKPVDGSSGWLLAGIQQLEAVR